MLPTSSAFFEEHDIEPDKRIMMIRTLAHDFRQNFFDPNLPDTPFALTRSPLTVIAEDAPETAEEELSNGDAAENGFLSDASDTILDQVFAVPCY